MARAGLLFVALFMGLLPMGSAGGATAYGEFEAAEQLRVVGGGTATADALAWLLKDPAHMSLRAPSAHICTYRSSLQEVEIAGQVVGLPPSIETSCYQLSSVELVQHAHHESDSWVGIDATGTLNVQLPNGTKSHAAKQGILSDHDGAEAFVGPEGDAPPEMPNYYRHLPEPHLRFGASSEANFSGSATVKILGPDVTLRAEENSSFIATGKTTTRSGATRTTTFEWLYVSFTDGNVAVGEARHDIAASRVRSDVSGEISFTATTGHLRTDQQTVHVERMPVRVTGDLALDMVPSAQGESILMSLIGDVSSSSLAPPVATGPAPRVPWPMVLLAAVAASGSVGGLLAWRVRSHSFPVEDCIDHYDSASKAGDHQRALTWIRRARRRAPKSAAYAMDEAFTLAALGRTAEALAAYAEADALSPYAEPLLEAARLLKAKGASAERVMELVRQAVKKEPESIPEIEADFAELAPESEWAKLRAEARASIVRRKR